MTVTAPPRPFRHRHASGLHAVSRALDALHRELIRNDDEADAAVVRTSVINLVAACTERDAADAAAADLLRIGTRHPTRAIVILAEPAAEPLLESEVSLHCAAGSRRVCMELVRLRVQGDSAYHLTSIVTPLLTPDMPVHLWIVGAPPLRQAFTEETVALTESMVIDTSAFSNPRETLALIAAQQVHYGEDLVLADLAWERTRVWREAIAHAFDAPGATRFVRRIERIGIRCDRDSTTEAMLLAGWLSSRLDDAALLERVHIETTGGGGSGLAAVTLGVRKGDTSGGVRVTRHGDVITAALDIPDAAQSARSLAVPAPARADLIGEMVTGGSGDVVYRAAVARAAALHVDA